MVGNPPQQVGRKSSPADVKNSLQQRLLDESERFLVVGIGASAGGLDACRAFLDALPGKSGIAFILVQHLDPTHESMMIDLLRGRSQLTVLQATHGQPIEPGNFYVIPPGTYLSIVGGALHLSQPQERHGARLPFDFLLRSLATAYQTRAVGVVLSGTGTDGSLGLKALKENNGLAITQDPEEASYDGMPRNAIMTGVVDLVLPVRKIPTALAAYDATRQIGSREDGADNESPVLKRLPDVIALLRGKTTHDFTLYKSGTLQRRIERRMAMAGIEPGNVDQYLDTLQRDADELDLLAKDFLINVTSFFRDQGVFDYLAAKVIPDLVQRQPLDQPLRIWVAGCSTGEETYSLAILFREAITAAQRDIKLQIFASDLDPDAVAIAREGFYPRAIEAEVSPGRLARFFSREDAGYRASPALRSLVVFAIQDILTDPPFARLDMVSCRNLLIYLRPETQAKVISLFHFALREGGLLLLGSAETAGNISGRFTVVSKPERIYRQIGRARLATVGLPTGAGPVMRTPARAGQASPLSRQAILAELCQRLIMENFAPAAILINRKNECLYSTGPVDHYLRVAPGMATHDLFALARPDLRIKLRSVIQRASQEGGRVVVPGGQFDAQGKRVLFNIAVQPVLADGEELLLVCFIDNVTFAQNGHRPAKPDDVSRVAEVEHELELTRAELQAAIRNLEISNEEQKAVNDEALSINEEYQSTNEELLTSKEELQSLNEELTALNSQLQETLERQRITSNDLQNVLYSSDVATLFLDRDLHIRFFTPATKSLFNVIPGDVGRPLSDLRSLAMDAALLGDATAVLRTMEPVEREIEAQDGAWYLRRILPYRTQENGIEGVVITFADVTALKRVTEELQSAKWKAELATLAKSRFLAAASHDLRQPLQTLTLLQGLLDRAVSGASEQRLMARFDETLGIMSGMLNTLLSINQIETGTIHTDIAAFPVNDVLKRLDDEFGYHSRATNLTFRVIPCALPVLTDPHLLEQMLRNLLSNAFKYTRQGKILLGCRRHGDRLRIEVWDTGIGIPEAELDSIFEEYHQVGNAARDASRGLGLGLAIVRHLGKLLEHPVDVCSKFGKGSVFSVDVGLALGDTPMRRQSSESVEDMTSSSDVRPGSNILVIEDDPRVRELLYLVLKDEGHHVITAADGAKALDAVESGRRPDLILVDYNLPNGMNGLQVAIKLRAHFRQDIPLIMLSGDISADAAGHASLPGSIQLQKPVMAKALKQAMQQLLSVSPKPDGAGQANMKEGRNHVAPAVIYIVDDDKHVRASLREVLEEDGRRVEDYDSCEAFLAAYHPSYDACLLIDAYLPGMSGIELLRRMRFEKLVLPSIMITGNSDVPVAVEAMKAGASDFLEKPVGHLDLLASIDRALEQSRDATKLHAWRDAAASHVAGLTQRQREIMAMVLAGKPSKIIAADLGISQRTVESHRATIMAKTGCKSLPALARLALAATSNDPDLLMMQGDFANESKR